MEPQQLRNDSELQLLNNVANNTNFDIKNKQNVSSLVTFQKLVDENKPIPGLTINGQKASNGEHFTKIQRKPLAKQHKSVLLNFKEEKPMALLLKEIESDYSRALKHDKELLSRIDLLKMDIEELEFENATITTNISRCRNKLDSELEDFKSLELQHHEKIKAIEEQFEAKLNDLQLEKSKLQHELDELKNGGQLQILQEKKVGLLGKIESLRTLIDDLSKNESILERKATIKRLKLEIKNIEESITTKKKKINDLSQFHSEFPALERKYIEQFNERRIIRRKLNDKLLDLKGTIRVFCRIKPPSSDDLTLLNYDIIDNNEIVISNTLQNIIHSGKIETIKSHFHLDHIFQPEDTNDEIFEEVSQLIQSYIDGNKVCIFAYGQTGSGKTYTMSNPKDGVIPRSVSLIFECIDELQNADEDTTYKLLGEFIEIYNESIIDLLDAKAKYKYEIRHNADLSTTIVGLSEIEIKSSNEFDSILNKISKVKKTAFTNSNENSSRSHTIFRIKLKKVVKATGEIQDFGLLSLIDLAGSERVSKSKVDGIRLKEAAQINKSLSCLGDVIHSFQCRNSKGKNRSQHIPFRNSKLTYLLQNSLNSNNCKTLMLVTVSPDANHIGETINSLRFAAKVNSTNTSASLSSSSSLK